MNRRSIYLKFLKENTDKSNKDIAKKIQQEIKELKSVPLDTIRRRLSELRFEFNLQQPELTIAEKLNKDKLKIGDIIEEDVKIKNLKTSASDYKAKYEHSVKELQKVNKQLETILNVRNDTSLFCEIPFTDNIKKSQSTAIAVASDWHFGEVVDPATVNNLNKFNLEIGKKRAEKFFQSIVKLVEIERTATEIDTLVFALLGDLMQGYLIPEFLENSDISPTETIIELRSTLIAGIEFLKKYGNFKQIIIPTAIGNHSRTTEKRRVATASKNSYEWLLYKILEADYADDKIVKFQVSEGYHNWINLYNKYDIRCHHGCSIGFNGGVGGLTIPVNKAISQWNKIKTSYLDLFGHFHTYFDGSIFLSNGSLVGYNAYALSIKASYEQPKQVFTLIDRDRGKTAVRPIFVTEK